ncbi:MAG: hypothetical protein KA534_07315 [Sediminibacterium sp.]|jgi:hypothetical protein|nr:hypothetical protein [Sediminibacterium sp.]
MSQEIQETSADKDIAKNWVSSSRFIFYVSVFALLSLVLGNCTKLFSSGFEKPEVEVNTSSQYKPEYK